MPKVHTLPRGEHIAPMPALRDGEINRRLQGGLPPEPNRTPYKRWGTAHKRTHTHTQRWLDSRKHGVVHIIK